MANKMFLLGLFLLSVANVKAQTQTQTDSITMETMFLLFQPKSNV